MVALATLPYSLSFTSWLGTEVTEPDIIVSKNNPRKFISYDWILYPE